MSKVEHAIYKVTFYASTIGLFVDMTILFYLKIQKNAIIHNLGKDILIDKWLEVCKSLLVVLIPMVVATTILLLFIYRQKTGKVTSYNLAEKRDTELSPTLHSTSYGRRKKQNITISDDFSDLFMPHFAKSKDELGDYPFMQFKEALKKSDWYITDLGRIARMCFEAEIHNRKYTNFKEWMIDFCKALNCSDYPQNPQKKDYKIDKDDLLSLFRCIVKIGEKKHEDYKKRISS